MAGLLGPGVLGMTTVYVLLLPVAVVRLPPIAAKMLTSRPGQACGLLAVGVQPACRLLPPLIQEYSCPASWLGMILAATAVQARAC